MQFGNIGGNLGHDRNHVRIHVRVVSSDLPEAWHVEVKSDSRDQEENGARDNGSPAQPDTVRRRRFATCYGRHRWAGRFLEDGLIAHRGLSPLLIRNFISWSPRASAV